LDRKLAESIASVPTSHVRGTFFRHVSFKTRTLTPSPSGGRWGPRNSYPVLYLGRPTDSVIVEAYRHLVEKVESDREITPAMVAPRRFLTCEVDLPGVLDLTEEEHRQRVGLTLDELTSPVDAYGPCHAVGQAAHQLGLRGILAPAATNLGETLAIFDQHVPMANQPIVTDTTVWNRLPDDPRISTDGVRVRDLLDSKDRRN